MHNMHNMHKGYFIFTSTWQPGQSTRLPVHDCPDPAAARAALEELLDRPVRWQRSL